MEGEIRSPMKKRWQHRHIDHGTDRFTFRFPVYFYFLNQHHPTNRIPDILYRLSLSLSVARSTSYHRAPLPPQGHEPPTLNLHSRLLPSPPPGPHLSIHPSIHPSGRPAGPITSHHIIYHIISCRIVSRHARRLQRDSTPSHSSLPSFALFQASFPIQPAS